MNIPFAPTAAASLTLAAISPTSGAPGARVTLTGTNLSAATTVNFGGTQITNLAHTPQGTIEVTAPTGSGIVQVSVGNGSNISNTLLFTYTQ